MNTARKLNRIFLSGDEAAARGAIDAGVKVACAYPGTPSTEILECLSTVPTVDAQWSVNEKVAFEVALGAAIGGVRSLYASKHVGLNVSMDPLMTAAYTGINAGFVAVVCDDPGLHSSQNEQDTRWVAPYAKVPMVEPANPSEAYRFIRDAFAISERFDTPVLFRMTTRVAHGKEDVVVQKPLEAAVRPLTVDAAKYVMVPRHAGARHKVVEKRLEQLARFANTTKLNHVELNNRKRGFVVSGVSYHYVKEHYPDASFLKLGLSYPFCDQRIREFAQSVREIVVVEELDPILEEHLHALGISCKGRHPSFRIGELRPEYVPDIVAGNPKKEQDVPARRPLLCRGCPHRFVFVALKRARTIVAGDIGCYTLAAAPPLAQLHTCICMGAGITVHEGFRRAHPDQRIVGVVGDSTFVHSGITGLINAVYNRIKGLIVILDNSTTAMTGGQQHPATGKTIREEPTAKLVLEDLCRACGVKNVDVISAYDRRKIEETIKKRLEGDDLSVLIARAPCRLIDRDAKPAPTYAPEACKTCGICARIDCPALTETADGHIVVDKATCMGCYLCADVCPAGALKAPA